MRAPVGKGCCPVTKQTTYAAIAILVGFVFLPTRGSALQVQVKDSFFGMHVSLRILRSGSWPSVPFSSLRLWDTKTSWAQLNPSDGKYDWNLLDDWLKEAQHHDVDVLYTFGHTPSWASSRPGEGSCAYESGSCAPPNDLPEDGSGSDQHWKDFVTAIVKHSAGRIKYWEIWNEPINVKMWSGTIPQMLRMARDASSIIKSTDPDALLLTPTLAMGTPRAKTWTNDYLQGGGGTYADALSYHAYLATPEELIRVIEDLKQTAAKYGDGSKPLWQTEGSWGRAQETGVSDPDQQADYVLRFYTILTSSGVAKFYWYAWDNPGWGTMWTPSEHERPAAGAYATVHKWLADAVFDRPCTSENHIWTCSFTRNGQNLIVWTDNQKAVTFTPPATFKQTRDLAGAATPVKGPITVSSRPVLLTNQ